jgi:hypothetical protein
VYNLLGKVVDMAMVFDILKEERNRLIKLKEKYERQLSGLPKGALSRKNRWNREYLYLAYRKSGKVTFDYIGAVDSEKAKELTDRIAQRKEIEDKLRQVNNNLAEIDRGLRGKQ